ncbi:DNA polymerase III, alpha subunit [Alicyclobacillus hesperidum URH17-3-68]|uniref:DNA polymerase III subunit alpha n=1 Tax=Alicyclobacillus hesperidum TaxID=89784 RepID=UPI000281B917|nr:DNA polymerase III subunit alpha [Alicyclobacillus hesperidum]EJY55510.1 DNA polymerase III, alpha subunit [Alicyclobacillus hesperidum URH17-3-68]
MADFVHLHVHSAYSFRESLLRIEDLVEAAALYEMPAIALTDTNGMYGAVSFYRQAKARGVEPVIGCQLQIDLRTQGVEEPVARARSEWRRELETVVLLARGLAGYRALTRLVTCARANGPVPFIRVDELAMHATDLICLIGGGESRLLAQYAAGDEQAAQRSLQTLLGACPAGQVYIDVQDHQKMVERQGLPGLLRAARLWDVPLVATNDARYRFPEDAKLHRAYAALDRPDAEDMWPTDRFALVGADEMSRRFANLPEALQNTVAIADECKLHLPLYQVQMPRYQTKDGRPSEIVLREAARVGATSRYGDVTGEIERRLQYELDVICNMGYADYFLVVADFIRYAHQRGISTGPGRGSAAGSLVAYALRITDVDPMANQLLFERFLNPERVSLPDIDTDFEYERRGEVISYVVDKYGRDRVAQIGTFGTLAARAALRDAGRMLGADPQLVDQLSKLVPGQPGVTLSAVRAQVPSFERIIEGAEAALRLYDAAVRLEGLPHHTSIHAAGVVIAPGPLVDWVPLDPGGDGAPVTQYAMDDIEALGLVKMDFLGLRTLTLVDACIRSIRERTGEMVDWRQIPTDDPATYDMLTRAETNGVFQLESPGMRRVLKQLRPTTLDDIVAVISLNRPGPMENIPAFCDAKHGRVAVSYPHPDLKPILQDTYGVIVYQEQIMQIASLMAGFSLGQADLLRRAVSKKKRDILDEERSRFVDGCLRNGYDAATAHDVYDLIVRFADYGFNRSHAAAYAVLAYRTAYLRAHHLPEFLAALMTMAMGAPDKIRTYEQDARRHRIAVLPPSVVHSERGYAVNAEGAIRTGLLAIRNVGEAAVEHILSLRRERPFSSLVDFLQRIQSRLVNRKALDSLLLAGAFDEFFPDAAAPSAKQQMFEEAWKRAEEARQFAGLTLEFGFPADDPPLRPSTSDEGTKILYIRYAGNKGGSTLRRVQAALSAFPGVTPVALYDATARRTRLLGERWCVEVTPELVTLLEEVVGIGNVRVREAPKKSR